MSPSLTLHAMIAAQSATATALTLPAESNTQGASPLTYADLSAQIEHTLAQLNGWGIGRGDRVAIVLPNCPEMATSFVAVASACTAAPLNMAYTEKDFEFYLGDIHARAVVIAQEGGNAVAVEVARKLGIAILWLKPLQSGGAGRFTLASDLPDAAPANPGTAHTEDVALILHTSGTTSRPKIVPLLHRNVTASAYNIQKSLELGPTDCGLHVMPMFHIHGLIAALLAPWAAGGQVFVTPGFNALKFFSWMAEARPSWYTAVPTMHQALLVRAEKGDNAKTISANPLRFLRSSSSSIPTQVISELERVFGAPLIEAYGMTEAAHQMCSNPLPPKKRRPGSVGIAAGPEVAIMDDEGQLLGSEVVGEVVIRGTNVTPGYENNPDANSKAFVGGWFRTGDQGALSADGYLTLTGRLKEIINRGGEKISPLKIDEALMDHPSVQQVVAFAMPHKMLGEAVAAVVVLREGCSASEVEIKSFAANKLSKFEVPEKIIFMNEIPKGATGKLQRIGLWDKLVIAGTVA
jgi:acyl-CoA synthetase (AMP-forming)/AMP-acid ligase II